jgi:hypothetical protein
MPRHEAPRRRVDPRWPSGLAAVSAPLCRRRTWWWKLFHRRVWSPRRALYDCCRIWGAVQFWIVGRDVRANEKLTVRRHRVPTLWMLPLLSRDLESYHCIHLVVTGILPPEGWTPTPGTTALRQ